MPKNRLGCRNLLWHSQLHDEPTSFFFYFIPIEAAHRRLSRRPHQLGGGVSATKPAEYQEIQAEEEQEGEHEEGREEDVGRRDSAKDKRATRRVRVAAEEDLG